MAVDDRCAVRSGGPSRPSTSCRSWPSSIGAASRVERGRHGVPQGQLTLHADRGSSMTSRTVSQLLSDRGVLQSHSRPHQSNDNPYSESQFKTLKYSPRFLKRFSTIAGARTFCGDFFEHYNNEHRHSGIGLHTPADVHFGRAEVVREKRQGVLDAAYATMPGRFRTPPLAPRISQAFWINRPEEAPLAVQAIWAIGVSFGLTRTAKLGLVTPACLTRTRVTDFGEPGGGLL